MKIVDDIILIVEYFMYFLVLTFLVVFLIIPYMILIFSESHKIRHKRDAYFYIKITQLGKRISKEIRKRL